MTEMLAEHHYASREAASAAVADRIAELCTRSIDNEGDARIVLSGGSTPARCFELLSGTDLAWHRVQVFLSDERWVPADNDNSNERLVREKMLVDKAAAAELLSLYRADISIDERAISLQASRPVNGFTSALLGMGADGHFASLFPGSNMLEQGLSADSDRLYVPVATAASPYPRLSMTLSALVNSGEIQLLFFGDEKMSVYRDALLADSELPVAQLLRQTNTPVNVYWSR